MLTVTVIQTAGLLARRRCCGAFSQPNSPLVRDMPALPNVSPRPQSKRSGLPSSALVSIWSACATGATGFSPAALASVGDLVGISPEERGPEHSRNGKEAMW